MMEQFPLCTLIYIITWTWKYTCSDPFLVKQNFLLIKIPGRVQLSLSVNTFGTCWCLCCSTWPWNALREVGWSLVCAIKTPFWHEVEELVLLVKSWSTTCRKNAVLRCHKSVTVSFLAPICIPKMMTGKSEFRSHEQRSQTPSWRQADSVCFPGKMFI